MRHYHRNEDFKIVKQRDDLMSRFPLLPDDEAKRQAARGMRRYRLGGPMPFAGQRRRGSGEVEIAKDMDFDVF